MNISELARQLKTEPQLLLEKLPELGIHIGEKAIQIDENVVPKAISAWKQYQRRETLKQKLAAKRAKLEEKKNGNDQKKMVVSIPEAITVADFAKKLDMPVSKVMVKLLQEGVMAAMNQKIEYDTAMIVAEDFGIKTRLEKKEETEEAENKTIEQTLSKESELENRPPVVVVMGHVDHGKTTLLDSIRKTNVAGSEAGAITQHIGAYQVTVTEPAEYSGRKITFIDTPGHEAFRGMRSRGGKVADIAVLVIAADDKIQPQTLESIEIIQNENLPMIVAVNKIDRSEANIDVIKTQLSEINLTPEDWGGDVICVPLSAKKGQNINDLLENILLVADIENFRSNPKGALFGTIIESNIDKGLGPIATAVVQNGTLKIGDLVACGDTGGRIKSLQDFTGATIREAPPSTPVMVLGLKSVPKVGDIVERVESLKEIKKSAKKYRMDVQPEKDSLKKRVKEKEEEKKIPQLKIFLKTDVVGTLEALLGEIKKLKHKDVEVAVIKQGLGPFSENDVIEAEAQGAHLIAFKVATTTGAGHLISARSIPYNTYTVIYKLLDDLKAQLESLIPPEIIEEDIGKAKVAALFGKSERAMIIGGRVIDGKVTKNAKFRIFRNGEVLGEGMIIDLQCNRESKEEVKAPQEFGIKYKGDYDIRQDDELQFYTTREEKQKL